MKSLESECDVNDRSVRAGLALCWRYVDTTGKAANKSAGYSRAKSDVPASRSRFFIFAEFLLFAHVLFYPKYYGNRWIELT